MWECIKHVIKPRGAVVLFGSQPFTSALVMSNPQWFKYCWVWEKLAPVGFLDANRKPLKDHEDIAVFSDGQTVYNPQGLKPCTVKSSRQNGKTKTGGTYGNVADVEYWATVSNYPRSILTLQRVTNNQIHPTQKPVELMSYLIKTYTNPGETVLDFTFGSCSTGVACLETGMNFLGIEKDPEYFRVGTERMEKANRRAAGQARKGKETDFDDLPLFA